MGCRPFKTSEANAKSFLRTQGVIDKYLKILDYTKFMNLQPGLKTQYKARIPNFTGELFYAEEGGTKAIPNRQAFKEYDKINVSRPNIKEILDTIEKPLEKPTIKTPKEIFEETLLDAAQTDSAILEEQSAQQVVDDLLKYDTTPEASEVPVEFYDINNTARAQEIAFKMADKLSKAFNLEYESISSQDAYNILERTKTPYRRQPAFFFNGKVYLVADRITLGNVLHEFAHPLVKMIAINNRPLFLSLYTQLKSTPEGEQIIREIKEEFPDLEETDDFMEEAIVRGLEKSAVDKVDTNVISTDNPVESKGFLKFIKEILYQIKQLFRKAVGKVDVKNLKADTTLDELATMLTNEDFVIEKSLVTRDDIANFQKVAKEDIEYLTSKLNNDPGRIQIQAVINDFYSAVKRQNAKINKFAYKDIKGSLVEEGDPSTLLNKLKSILAPVNTRDLDVNDRKITEEVALADQSHALINSVFTLKVIVNRLSDNLSKIRNQKDSDSLSDINTVTYYDRLLRTWDIFIKSSIKDLSEFLQADSPLMKELAGIETNIKTANHHIYTILKRASADVLYTTLKPIRENIQRDYDNRIKQLEEAKSKPGANLSMINKELDEAKTAFKTHEITKEKLEATLRGETEDLNWFNKEAEGILNVNDPVIGAFGLILKEAHRKSERAAIDQNQERIMDLGPALKKTGYSTTNYNTYWDQYLFSDTTSEVDQETGNVVEKKIYTLLNPVKDWRYEKRKRYDEFAKKRATLSKEELVKEAKELRDWDRKYFHQKYKSEYYSADVIFDQTYEDTETKEIIPIGDEAWLERQLILDDMKNLRDNSHNEGDEYEQYKDMDVLRTKYNQLYSLSFEDATPKAGVALAKAKLLREHRKLTQKFYEYKPIPNAFEKAFEEFVQYAQDNIGEINSPEFKEAVYGKTGWLARNTKMSYAKEWYTEVGNIMEAIKTTSDRFKKRFSSDAYKQKLKDAGLKVDDIDLDVSDTFTTIFDLMAGYKDENGERVASDIDPKRMERLYSLQEDINKMEQKLSILTGFSVDEAEAYAELSSLQEDGPLDEANQIRFNELLAKQGAFPISEFEILELKGLFKQLKAIQYKEPTENYVEVINTRLTALKQASIDKTTANAMLENTPYIDTLLESSKDFRDWFTKNHIKKEYYNNYLGQRVTKWERLYAWSVTKPTSDKFINKFSIKDPITGEMIERLGEPASKFSYRQVKNEYRNIPVGLTPEQKQAYIGVVVNNMGEYLPKSLQSEIKNPVTGKMDKLEIAPDNTFINEEYYKMKTENPDKFEVLEKTTKWHLKSQVGSSKESKLYLDIPRYEKDSYELLKTGNYLQETFKNTKSTIKGAIASATGKGKEESNLASRRPEDFDQGLANYISDEAKIDDILQFSKLNIDNQDYTRIPVTGLANIQEDLVSKDLLLSMAKYSYSLEKQKGLIEINPIAQGLKNVLNNPESHLKDMTKASLLHRDERNTTKYNDKKGDKNKRLDLFNYIYGREFEGKIYGDNEGMDWLNKWSNKLMKGASFSFFALNIPSAVKNYWGALWQMNMEAIAGNSFKKQEGDVLAETSMNAWSFAKGKVKAKSLIWDWTNSIYGLENAENVSLDMQLIRKFDPIQGKTEEKHGQTASRSFIRDLASMSFFYSPRKFMEIEAGLQLYAGMMMHQMVEITEDGVKHLIPYMEAFELDSAGKAKLRDGIDKAWDFGGEKFNTFTNRIHETSNQLQGSFAKFDQPAAQRFFAYRLWSFMRRYFTAMFMARWSRNRLNFGLSNTYEGFYRTFGKSMVKLFKSYGKYWSIMSPKERKAFGKMLSDLGHMVVLYFAISMIFGYDDEDPDRFKKLRAQEESGLAGWLGVHLLSLSIATAQENESFTPMVGFGLDDYVKMTNMSSVAMGPTIETYSRLLSDIYNINDEKAYYQKDVGPYSWQKEGSFKFWNHLGRITGLNGKDLVPSMGIQSREGFAK